MSLTGYVYTLFGKTDSWKASLQHIVILSTTKAEYAALDETVKEGTWIKGLVYELGVSEESIFLHYDSQSVIHLNTNSMYYERTKHIDVHTPLHKTHS